jgi:ATP:ADP antiporter, AAA family
MQEKRTSTPALIDRSPPSLLDRALRVFTDVRRGEGVTGLLMLASVFMILTSYYLLKPAREGLLATAGVDSISKIELKAYTSFGQGLLLLGVIPAYSRLASGLDRRRLITWVNVIFVSNLVVFWLLQPGLIVARVPYLGIAYYLWVGIFNVLVIAQFWAFAADIYSEERGKRLFPMIAIGSSAGAVVGSWLTDHLVNVVGTYVLLLIAAVILGASVVLARVADARGPAGEGPERDGDARKDEEPLDKSGAFKLVFTHRYLLVTAVLILVLNWVNTNGENSLFGAIQEALSGEMAQQGITGAAAQEAFISNRTTQFYGNFQFWVNVAGLVMQSVLASRLLKYGGFGALLMMLPVVALTSYSLMAIIPALGVIKVMKIAENATDYSINNTAKQVLWLPTTREMKYKAKAAIDTLFVRFGDGLAALTVFVVINQLKLPVRVMFVLNIALVVVWIVLGISIVRQHRRLAARSEAQAGERGATETATAERSDRAS